MNNNNLLGVECGSVLFVDTILFDMNNLSTWGEMNHIQFAMKCYARCPSIYEKCSHSSYPK